MKQIFLLILTLSFYQFLNAQNDATDDSWVNNASGQVETKDAAIVRNGLEVKPTSILKYGLDLEGVFHTYSAILRNKSGGNNAGGLLVETTDGNGLANAFRVNTFIGVNPQTIFRIPNAGRGNKIYMVENGGSVGIRTTEPEHELDVCGNIRAREIIVEEGWCDYVFDKNYQLPTLEEQEAFIEENGHLKNFESESEMNGQIKVGDVSKRQQQTLEEVMLYLIDLKVEMADLKKEMVQLKKENKTLKKEVELLKN